MKEILKKLFFPVIGLLSLLWFLIRVIPKPSRASYPCMRATMPIASSFVIYVLGLVSSLFVFKRAKKYLYESKYILFLGSLFVGMIVGISTYLHTGQKVYAEYQTAVEGPNLPMGIGQGVNPGRVAWIHNPAATNENCPNTNSNYWSMDTNTDQAVVNSMVSQALQSLTGESTDADAWSAIFHYYNQTHGNGDVGYSSEEKIVIKINLNGYSNWAYGERATNTSPQICWAVLNQLINVVGVPQANISIGDPNRDPFPTIFWNKLHSDFPNVHYWGNGSGQTPIEQSDDYELYTSDGDVQMYIPKSYVEAAYLINIPVLKKHHRAGISITSKNHFGTIAPFHGGAWDLHYSLPCPDGSSGASPDTAGHGKYGSYRCFVDLMGHENIGGKTVIHIVDGLWSSTNWGHPPIKWAMTPFNNDYPNSIFVSQDPVAVQSVCFDFLFNEFDEDHPTEGDFDFGDNTGPYPHYPATDDFLHQAASSENWPAGFTYDPENDDTPLPSSMGVHEHWNNATAKLYSRNLGEDEGIELVSTYTPVGIFDQNDNPELTVEDFSLYQNYPNPFNASTNIYYTLSKESQVRLDIYNALGQKVRTMLDENQAAGPHIQRWNGLTDNGLEVPTGVYFYQIIVKNDGQYAKQIKKMVMSK
jgi:hypothetical protein